MKPPPIPASARKSKGGCGLGCGLLVGLVLLMGIVGLVWFLMFSGRRDIDVAQVVGSEATAVVHLTQTGKDPGLQELMRKLQGFYVDAMSHGLQQDLPPSMRGWATQLSKLGGLGGLGSKTLPEIVIALQAKPGGELGFVALTELDATTRMMGLALAKSYKHSGAGTVVVHRGYDLLQVDPHLVLCLSGRNLLVGDSVISLKQLVDRLEDAAPGRGVVTDVPPELAEEWDLYLVSNNDEHVLATVPSWITRELAGTTGRVERALVESAAFRSNSLRQARVALDVHAADWVRGLVEFHCVDDAAANACVAEWSATVEPALNHLQTEGLEVMVTSNVEAGIGTIEMDVTRLEAWLDKQFAIAIGNMTNRTDATMPVTLPVPQDAE